MRTAFVKMGFQNVYLDKRCPKNMIYMMDYSLLKRLCNFQSVCSNYIFFLCVMEKVFKIICFLFYGNYDYQYGTFCIVFEILSCQINLIPCEFTAALHKRIYQDVHGKFNSNMNLM